MFVLRLFRKTVHHFEIQIIILVHSLKFFSPFTKCKYRNQVSEETLIAIKNGDTDVLEKIIPNESLNDCFYMDFESENYLVHSITYKSLKSLQFFVEKGANIEAICENKTPLMYAIKYGEFEMVKYLIEKGANLKANNHGKTPLYYTRTYEYPEIEKYLISKNAD
jgi:ankyrin repeat protein